MLEAPNVSRVRSIAHYWWHHHIQIAVPRSNPVKNLVFHPEALSRIWRKSIKFSLHLKWRLGPHQSQSSYIGIGQYSADGHLGNFLLKFWYQDRLAASWFSSSARCSGVETFSVYSSLDMGSSLCIQSTRGSQSLEIPAWVSDTALEGIWKAQFKTEAVGSERGSSDCASQALETLGCHASRVWERHRRLC